MARGLKTALALLVATVCVTACQEDKSSGAVAQVAEEESAPSSGFDIPALGAIADPDAKAIVEAMYAAYAECDTYSDTGTLVFGDTRMTFATRYKSPNRLYFEFTAENNARNGRHVYWTEGVRGTSHYDILGMEGTEEDVLLTDCWYSDIKSHEEDWPLSLAIAGFTGISMHTGMSVPTMLFPEETPVPFIMSFADLVFEGTDTVRGSECDVLYSEAWTERFWIDHDTHMLLRVTNRMMVFDNEVVTEYWPEVDGEIDDAQMVFDVPN